MERNTTLERLRAFVEHPDSPREMTARLGYVGPVSFDPETGKTRVEFLVESSHCHSGGRVAQGGFVAGWLDNAMANAVFAATDFKLQPISLDLNVSYYASTPPGPVFVDAWIAKRGKSIAFLEAVLLDANDTIMAKATSTAKLMPLQS
ncbi:MAG: PaaI family thioesterase [Pseudomonadota bacterium]